IELARWATRILIAPASADIIARLAAGIADDLLTTVCLASAAPLLVAPAMNQQMWKHAATQANAATLYARGVEFLGPASGDQACGDIGPGRLLEPIEIIAALVARQGPRLLDGKRVVVSAGPTFEDIDPVRYIGNRSSGRMGFAIAAAAIAQGAMVDLVAGPVSLDTPRGARRVDVRSAQQMHDAVMAAVAGADIFISAAAVADYRPETMASAKIKKDSAEMALTLVRNPDIVNDVAARADRPFVVGFAAETDEVEQRARAKLAAKKLDLIAANRVGAEHAFDRSDNALVLLWADGREDLGHADKNVLAEKLIARIAQQLPATRA
ncbi:MAG: bifunctional phosphopantothenoylcysteine decarboxylase/phosphopantothenate--cysteine ligase CoaBC, partial [Dokdonella sp.]